MEMTPARIAAEYRAQYALHQSVVARYSRGEADARALKASADELRRLQLMFQVEKESRRAVRS
jgi:hypothetical protein